MDYAPRILIIDDEHSVRAFFEQVLSEDGYYTSSVGTVRHALQIIDDQAFEIVVVDLSLPDGDGLDLVRQMRAASPNLKILATSGFLVGDMPSIALQAGATATLAKPTTGWQLRNTVYQMLEPAGRWRGAGR